MIIGVMIQDVVELFVTMDNHVNVSLLLGFMHVFGRSDGQQCHRRAEHARQSPGHRHKFILLDKHREPQTRES